jgi:magnesium-transporting ATPase (P-type)
MLVADPGQQWQRLTAAEAADELAVSVAVGLDEVQVRQRRAVSGPNTLPEPNRRSRVMLLADQVRNPLVLLLLGAAVIAGMVAEVEDAAVSLAVVVINSVLGFVQESRAENSRESLRRMLAPTCAVRRGGVIAEIPARALAFIVVVQVVVVSAPAAQGVFDTVSLTPVLWLVAAATACLLLLVDETRKAVIRRQKTRAGDKPLAPTPRRSKA